MNGLLENTWVVSLASIIITFAVTPVLQRSSEWVRSRRGALTGTYLALSESGNPASLRAEIIKCRNIGEHLAGTITARADFTLSRKGDIEAVVSASGRYSFTGRMLARQILLNYWSPAKASQNGGTMTMTLDANATAFRGIWCGTATNGGVTSGRCMWIKNSDMATPVMGIEQLTEMTNSVLRSIANPWHEVGSSSMRMQKLQYFTHAVS